MASPLSSRPVNTRRDHVRRLARRLAALKSSDRRDVSLLGLMAGALHLLDRAAQLGYADQRGTSPDVATFAGEFHTTLKALGRGVELPRQWRAGFYFISALFRLAALNPRLRDRFPRGWPDDVARSNLMQDVNRLKHSLRAHPISRLTTRFGLALAIADAMCTRLERGLG